MNFLAVKLSDMDIKCQRVPLRGKTDVAELQRQLHSQSETWPFSIREVPTFAFITGTIRNHWESLDSNAKLSLQQYVSLAFESRLANEENVVRIHVDEPACACPICAGHIPQNFFIRPISALLSEGESEPNFFLNSEEESRIEFVGVEKLYEQLKGLSVHTSCLTESASCLVLEGSVVAVLSVENSCSRLTMLDKEGNILVFDKYESDGKWKRLPGMSEAKDLPHFPAYLATDELIHHLTQTVVMISASDAQPIIALKAGEPAREGEAQQLY